MLHSILFATTFLSGVILAFVNTPVFAFVLYEVVYFFYPQSRWWGYQVPDISYSYISVLIMAIVLAFNFHKLNTRLFSAAPLNWFFVIVFLYLITYFWALVPDNHISTSINLIKLAIIIAIAYKLCDSEKSLDLMIFGFFFGATYLSILTYQIGRNSGSRVEGLGTVDAPDANGIAAALAPVLVLALFYFWKNKNKYKGIVFAIIGIVVANALILINSRGAFLGASVGIGYFIVSLYFSKQQLPRQKPFVILILILGFLGGARLADESFLNRMFGITGQLEYSESKETGGTRVEFWKAAFNMSKDYPFGKGRDSFIYLSPFYVSEDIHTGQSRNRAVHSTWFEVLTEIGYIGLTLFLLLVFSVLRLTQKIKKHLISQTDILNYQRITALQGAFLCFLVTMTFLNRFQAEIFYWLILFISSSYQIYVLNNRSKN